MLSSLKDVFEGELTDALKQFIADAPDGFIALNDNNTVVMYNKAAANLFGYDEQEILGLTLDKMLTMVNADANIIASAKIGPSSSRHLLVARRKSGEDFPCEVSFSRTIVDGNIFCIVCLRDASDQLENEKKIEKKVSRLNKYRSDKKAKLLAELQQVKNINILR